MYGALKNIVHPIDSLRTAPFGISMCAGNTTVGIAGSYLWHESVYAESVVLACAGIALSGINAVLSARLAHKQFKLRQRLEETIGRHGGYQDQLMEPTVRTWCDRQTARLVSEQHDALADYDKLCEENREILQLRFLPHI